MKVNTFHKIVHWLRPFAVASLSLRARCQNSFAALTETVLVNGRIVSFLFFFAVSCCIWIGDPAGTFSGE